MVAVCHVNRASHGYLTPDRFLGREPIQAIVNQYYPDKAAKGTFNGCDAYRDFREILGRSDIDVVVIVVLNVGTA